MACIDACPTDAIVDEYIVDSNKCISYLTIENKNAIREKFKNNFNGWLFGCDICQDVCPWNQKFSIESLVNEFHPQKKELFLNEVLEMKEEEFRTQFKHSPLKRAKLSGIKRNAAFLKRK
jgi:epoxyqueuosine reductase